MRGLAMATLTLVACSPEARRVRDGGPGADIGNKVLNVRDEPDPHAADTTLWPGRALAPVDLFAKGIAPPPTYPAAGPAAVRDTSGRTAEPRRNTNHR